ncbi:MAG TPA: hypothetical protein VK552_05370, partial [Reyranella sp.]|nr:hypothetical protein [Reyranella sp.]
MAVFKVASQARCNRPRAQFSLLERGASRVLRTRSAFAERAEPEEVLELLRDYHATLVPLIQSFEGTLDRFAGDGLMVFFNDPLPC